LSGWVDGRVGGSLEGRIGRQAGSVRPCGRAGACTGALPAVQFGSARMLHLCDEHLLMPSICRASQAEHLPAPHPPACSFVQGAAAAQNGISVVQPNVGRLHDWYNRHPGMIRDPNVSPCLPASCCCCGAARRAAACLPALGLRTPPPTLLHRSLHTPPCLLHFHSPGPCPKLPASLLSSFVCIAGAPRDVCDGQGRLRRQPDQPRAAAGGEDLQLRAGKGAPALFSCHAKPAPPRPAMPARGIRSQAMQLEALRCWRDCLSPTACPCPASWP
jgi:hypothetical protein